MVNMAPNWPPPRTPRTESGSITMAFTTGDSGAWDLSFRSPDLSPRETGAHRPSVLCGMTSHGQQSLDTGPPGFALRAIRRSPPLRSPSWRREFLLAFAPWRAANGVPEDSRLGAEPR